MDNTKELAKVCITPCKPVDVNSKYRYLAKGTCGWHDDIKVYKSTTCGGCNTELISWSKYATCPDCEKVCCFT